MAFFGYDKDKREVVKSELGAAFAFAKHYPQFRNKIMAIRYEIDNTVGYDIFLVDGGTLIGKVYPNGTTNYFG